MHHREPALATSDDSTDNLQCAVLGREGVKVSSLQDTGDTKFLDINFPRTSLLLKCFKRFQWNKKLAKYRIG